MTGGLKPVAALTGSWKTQGQGNLTCLGSRPLQILSLNAFRFSFVISLSLEYRLHDLN
jgi:hypothetical protein